MSLVAYTITAIERDVADATISGKQVIAGATCSMYIQPADTVVTLYDDAAGTGGASSKVTGANGQVTVYVEGNKTYRLSVNGVDSYVRLSTDDASYENVSEMVADSITDGVTVRLDRYYSGGDLVSGLNYYVKTAAQAASDGDTVDEYINHTLANGNIAVLQHNGSINANQAGLVGDLSSDDTLSAQAAIDSGLHVIFSSAFRTTSSITINTSYSNIEFTDNAYIQPDPSVLEGVIIGKASPIPTRMKIDRLKVDRGSYSGATENIGIKFIECNQSDFYGLESRHSKYNFKFITDTAGFAYNNIYNPQAIGGYYNFWLTATSPGFTNENKFFGGRGFDSGTMITNLYITDGADVNNNQFFGMSLEGNAESSIYCDASSNYFLNPRTEGTWSDCDIIFGPNATYNKVVSTRSDTRVNDYLSDGSNDWETRSSGSKDESGVNNTPHSKSVYTGVHSTEAGDPNVISGVSLTDPVVITSTAHTLSTGDFITIRKVGGTEELNGQFFKVGATTANTFEILDPTFATDIDGTAFTAYTSGGYAVAGVPMNSIEDVASSTGVSHAFDIYHGRDGADSYVFRSLRDTDGLVRSSLTTDGRFTAGRNISIGQSGYNFEPLRMGNHYFWMNGNDFRGSIGVPTSATDGSLIATLT